jgi:signal peptide peptidase SppA
MSHKLLRFTEGMFSRPHLITQAGFDFAASYLINRNKYGLMKLDSVEDDDTEDEDDFDPEIGIGVIPMYGPLTYKPVYGMCGEVGCSYETIIDQAEDMIEEGIQIIVLDCDSPGGEGYAAFETANQLRALCDANDVQLYAYNDGCMASAAYAISCVADEVICNPSAETGSIGVVISLMNYSKALENAGVTRTFITAGDSKVPFDDSGDWKPEFIDDLQMKVYALYEDFVNHVAEYTGISVEAIKNTEAKTFMAQDALSLGLVNKVMTRTEFSTYIGEKQQENMNEI